MRSRVTVCTKRVVNEIWEERCGRKKKNMEKERRSESVFIVNGSRRHGAMPWCTVPTLVLVTSDTPSLLDH